MKNKIIALFAIIFSANIFAGPKADIEKANKLLLENKPKEAIEILKKSQLVKGEEVEFEQINHTLGLSYINAGDTVNAEKYLKIVSDNLSSKSDIAKDADRYLIYLAKDDEKKSMYLERLSNRSDNKDPQILAELNAMYTLSKNNKKLASLTSLIKSQGENYVDVVGLMTGQVLLSSDEKLALQQLNKVLKSKNPKIVGEANFTLATYNISKKNFEKAKENIAKAEKIDGSNAILIARIGGLYKVMGDMEKSFTYLKKAYKLDSKQLAIVIDLIENSYERKNKKDQNIWSSIARNFDKSVTNLELAKVFLSKSNFGLAKEFAIEASKKGDKTANLLLFGIYLEELDKDNLLKTGNEILKTGSNDEKERIKAIMQEPDLALAKASYDKQNLNKALEFAKMSVKNNKNAYLMLAHIYLRLGDIKEAKKQLNQSITEKVNVEESKKLLEQLGAK